MVNGKLSVTSAPLARIIANICPDPVQFILIADDAIPVKGLPSENGIAGSVDARSTRRFETADDGWQIIPLGAKLIFGPAISAPVQSAAYHSPSGRPAAAMIPPPSPHPNPQTVLPPIARPIRFHES
jgi:hypothetical protein